MTTVTIAAPADLSPRATGLWSSIVDEFELTPAELELLAEACRALDRADQARESIDELGPVVFDRYNSPKTNPACDIEARARSFYAAAVKQLGVASAAPGLSQRESARRGQG